MSVAGKTVIDAEDAERGLRRVAQEIVERHRGSKALLLVGIARGGVPLAESLSRTVAELEGHPESPVPVGSVDITLYRDDAATALPKPRIGPTKLPVTMEGRRVVLVDDVLFTGRTIRAALDALLDYGRPDAVELAVLVDRGGRELPIQADYVVKRVEVGASERVDVHFSGGRPSAALVPKDTPSLLPPPVTESEP